VSVHEISSIQMESRQPFSSVGMVCSCGRAIAGIEGVTVTCPACGTVYIISVMVLKRAKAVETKEYKVGDKYP
jgi:predicted RNA-binding Zn-ribbon protein involved in translation (DUF1610 family)